MPRKKTILERESRRRRGPTSPERVRRNTRATTSRTSSPERRKQTKATVRRTSSPERRKQTKATTATSGRRGSGRSPQGGASRSANDAAYRRFMNMTPQQRKYVINRVNAEASRKAR